MDLINLSYNQINTKPLNYKSSNITENIPVNTPPQEKETSNVNQDGVKLPANLKVKDIRKSGTPVESNPVKSNNMLNIQADISKTVTGQIGELQIRKENLEKLGIKWSDNGNNLNEQEEIKLMKSLEDVADKVPADKRPNISIDIKERDPDGFAGGKNYAREKKIELFAKNPVNGDKLDEKKLTGNLIHEYGHAIDVKLNEEKFNKTQDMSDRYFGVKDFGGGDLKERADKLEARAEMKGFNPAEGKEFSQGTPAGFSRFGQSLLKKLEKGKISEEKFSTLANSKWDDLSKKENPNYVYDKYDPYVNSLNYNKDGKHLEKYARASKEEYFAETFKTYASNPESFRTKMTQMEDYLKTHKEGTGEYGYVKESLGIMKDSYKFFQDKVFNGHEF